MHSLLAFNLFLILFLVEEMLRTRCWANLSLFGYNSLKGIIVASSMGGRELANKVVAAYENAISIWVADLYDKTANGVQLKM